MPAWNPFWLHYDYPPLPQSAPIRLPAVARFAPEPKLISVCTAALMRPDYGPMLAGISMPIRGQCRHANSGVMRL